MRAGVSRGASRSRSASSAPSPAQGRPATTRSNSGHRAMTARACSQSRRVPARGGRSRRAVALASRSTTARVWRYVRRLLLAAGAMVVGYFVVGRLSRSRTSFTHAARAAVPKADLGAPYENGSFKTADGLTLRGWYVPSRNRAAVISAPGRADSQKPARDARASRLRRAALRPPRRGQERRRPAHLRLGRRAATSRPPSRSCSGATTSTATASAGSGSRSAARRCCKRQPSRTASRPSSRTARGRARSARTWRDLARPSGRRSRRPSS